MRALPPLPTPPVRSRGHLSALIERFSGLIVTVVGDVICDDYLDGPARRLAREAPVPVVAVERRQHAAGGAANVAVGLAALGARARLVSVVGDDEDAARVLEIADAHGVDTSGVVRSGRRRTAAKRRVMGDGQMLLRFDEGSEGPLEPDDERALLEALSDRLRDADAVVASDYRIGLMTDRVIRALGRRRDVPLVVDAKDPRRFRRLQPTACTPNFDEACTLLPALADGPPDARAARVAAAAAQIRQATGAGVAVVTLDCEGAVVLERGRPPHRVYTEAAPERSSTGAGDSFTAALTLALIAGPDPATAADIASAAAAVVVGKTGTATCCQAELRLRLLPGGKVIGDAAALGAEGARHRDDGRRIVFTNGCFDILHRGHVTLLNAARALGDILVVAVNGDDSVRRLKGPSRPVNSLADRIEVLAALSCVDHIVPFHDDQPVELIRALRPDVLVKGGDYTEETVPEAALVRALGGEVRILDLVPDRSTTSIVDRIRLGLA